jgi:hypothetical protein
LGQVSRLKSSRRKTSKVWLGLNTICSFAALFYAINRGLDGAALALAGLPPFFYGTYIGVGHLDYKQVLRNPMNPMENPDCPPS